MSEQPSSKNWFRSPQRFFLDAPKQQPGTCFVKNDDYVEATDEIERLQREVNELELTHRVKDNKDLAARDLAELRPCYSVTGLETFIAKHFPALELRERTAHEPSADQCEIVTVNVVDGEVAEIMMKAPGLPDGLHDLFCVPARPLGENEYISVCPFCGNRAENSEGAIFHHPACRGLKQSDLNNLQVHEALRRAALPPSDVQRDAERYRFLRSETSAGVRYHDMWHDLIDMGCVGEDFDAAVDRGLKRHTPTKSGSQPSDVRAEITKWRDDALEAAAQICDRYGLDAYGAGHDIRMLKSDYKFGVTSPKGEG